MTEPTNDFSHPATKVASCMAVIGSLQGVSMKDTAPIAHSGSRLNFAVFVDLPSSPSGARVVLKTTVQVFCIDPLKPSSFDHEQLLLLALDRVRWQKAQSLDPFSGPREKLKTIRREFADKVERARATRGPACGDTVPAAGAEFSDLPDGNHGDIQTPTTTKAVL